MINLLSRSRQFSLLCSNEKGLTILEILIGSFLGVLVTATAYSALIIHQRSVINDVHRTRLSQNLRSALDFLAVDSRQAGEQLPAIFPAIILTDGGAGQPDVLTFRRNILSEEITVCSDIAAGSNLSTISMVSAVAGAPPVCVYGSQSIALDTWEEHRSAEGGSFKAYIFNTGTRLGEFITITNTVDSGVQMSLSSDNQSVTNAYPAYTSVVYVIEEWRYELTENNILTLTENQDEDGVKNIAFDITGFEVKIISEDGTVLDDFAATDNWDTITGIQVTLSGQTDTGKKVITDSINSTFFPRNILSL